MLDTLLTCVDFYVQLANGIDASTRILIQIGYSHVYVCSLLCTISKANGIDALALLFDTDDYSRRTHLNVLILYSLLLPITLLRRTPLPSGTLTIPFAQGGFAHISFDLFIYTALTTARVVYRSTL